MDSLHAFAVPLPPELEDEDVMMVDNMMVRKPNYDQKELKKQCYGKEDKVRQILGGGIDSHHSYSFVSLCAPK